MAESAYILRNGQWVKMSHRSLARFIEGAPEYAGQPVRLLACNAGACANGLAQNLANKMGVTVQAATREVMIDASGNAWSSGQWLDFTPGP